MKVLRNIGLITLISVSFWACKGGGKDDPGDTYDQTNLLNNYARGIIQPGYNALNASLETLDAKVTNFTQSPSQTTLDEVRTAWKTALLNWEKVSVYEFGPAADVLLRDNVNLFPVDTTLLINNVTSADYDLDVVSNYPAKGFQAMDFLLFGVASTDAQIIAKYDTDSLAANRTAYLKAVVSDIASKVSTVNTEWTSGSYIDSFEVRTGVDLGSSTSILVNALSKYWEVYVRDGKIGIPAGSRSFSGTPLPDKVEAYYANDFSVELCSTSVQALKNLYLGVDKNGADMEGLDDYLIHLEAESATGGVLNTEIIAQFDVVLTKLNVLNEPLSDEVVNNQAAVQEVFEEMQQLAILIKVDMPASFGTLITYTDNDGD